MHRNYHSTLSTKNIWKYLSIGKLLQHQIAQMYNCIQVVYENCLIKFNINIRMQKWICSIENNGLIKIVDFLFVLFFLYLGRFVRFNRLENNIMVTSNWGFQNSVMLTFCVKLRIIQNVCVFAKNENIFGLYKNLFFNKRFSNFMITHNVSTVIGEIG